MVLRSKGHLEYLRAQATLDLVACPKAGSQVVFGLSGSGVDGAAFAEKTSNDSLLRGPLLSGDALELADQQFTTVINIHVGDGCKVVIDGSQLFNWGRSLATEAFISGQNGSFG